MRLIADRTKAVQWAIRQADPLDTIVIVTGTSHDSASQARTDYQFLESIIDEARSETEPVDPGPMPQPEGTPVKLKLFP